MITLPKDMTSSQWVAHTGLDPVPKESGDPKRQKKHRQISKRGNKYLRTALFMPALVAIQHCPNVNYEHLVARGKAKMQAIVAVMRKLLIAIWGMFKNNENFERDKFYRIAA